MSPATSREPSRATRRSIATASPVMIRCAPPAPGASPAAPARARPVAAADRASVAPRGMAWFTPPPGDLGMRQTITLWGSRGPYGVHTDPMRSIDGHTRSGGRHPDRRLGSPVT
ncbi:exported hypothetical protein [Frankia canadensis]|uniref:Uncharacterized protein n=1 Tax=Frankia canadensis TaxID=1836972 RepID=A0A2I2KJK1_9ACTN|nr:exported hypothetical protein [Frankia canadensis]SOU53133.1 exported hypothetical protein [Frankia canadensis]